MNFWVFPLAVFGHLAEGFAAFLDDAGTAPESEFLLPDAVNDMVAARGLTVRLRPAPGPWLGLTHPEDRQRTAAALAEAVTVGTYETPVCKRGRDYFFGPRKTSPDPFPIRRATGPIIA
jgi:hypothetical protein